MERQGDRPSGDALRHGEVAGPAAEELAVERLEMDGGEIVAAADAAFPEAGQDADDGRDKGILVILAYRSRKPFLPFLFRTPRIV